MASPILPGTGLGSGLDISSIVTALVNADKSAKQTQITTQTTLTTSKISGVGSLKSALAAYQAAMDKLNSSTSPAFAGFAATSSTPSTLTVTSDNTAVNGNYNINVKNLATGSKVASASFAGGATSAIPSGTLNISQNGTAYSVTIPSGATLQSTRDAINTTLTAQGITANIVTDSNGSRLVIGSTATGKGSDLTVSGIAGLAIDGTKMMGTIPDPSSTTGGTMPDPASSGTIGALAADASLTIDGLALTSKTNTISQAVGGLSMTLVAPGTSTVNVATNTSGLQTSIQSFVDAYNTLVKTVTSLTQASADASGKLTVSAALTGDSVPRSIIADIRNQLVTPGPGGQLAVLAQLGITTDQKAGTLNFDSVKFTTAMTTQGLSSQVQTLFTGTNSTNGLLARMGTAISPYLQTGGILDQRTTSLNVAKNDLSNQQVALDLRVTTMTATLSAKYNAMDLLVGQMKATSTSITSFFSSLNAQKSSG
ncbi:flagellar filament capping protein FliD [Pseudomonas sp. 6D_7.1_Bac1]|uniref:flagellar filament capping protein FliD n=1 Tax=Pseudomonas sp. 6D_7.1_Bac1 TaxID=2971615 RepID=UPI0021CA9762|nr:flagellar filament capping protein FliD [Pseudomonas sp. 6D_7.1_Bac1]MCU1752504.1 flagellar filament capping protein FliD [Pseudomonas sp. 6D_7.1_Bac1]